MKLKTLLFLLLALLGSTVLHAYDAVVDDIAYNFSGNEAEVTEGGNYFDDVVIPESVTYNGITYSVTSIGNEAFRQCGLTSITIPNSVTSIGEWAFIWCGGLTSIIVEEGNACYDSRENSNAIIKTGTNTLIVGCQNTIIPNDVTDIGSFAFFGCSSLTSITIPESVTRIGGEAFRECSSLTSITIPESVICIEGYAFQDCRSLTSITFQDGLTSIGEYAFIGCGITSITIPESVTSIGQGAFPTNLTSIIVDEDNLFYDSRDNCNAIIETETNTLIIGCKNTIIPNDVTSIGYQAFVGCTGLTSITIPESVTTIDGRAFYGCTDLTSVTISEGVTSIGESAFCDCSSLTQIIIPNSVTLIYGWAFMACTSLTSITLPESEPYIEGSTFNGCGSLTSVTIPNNWTSIPNEMFLYCGGLTFIAIPESVTSIGERAFTGCSGLRHIYCYAEEVPNTGSDAFEEVNRRVAKLHVPPTSVEAYSTTEPWSSFKNIVAIESYVLTYMVDGKEYKTYPITEGKPIVPEEEPTKEGYTFSGWSEIPDRMPAEDVVVTGSFSINSYTITYIVDGEEYKTDTLEYNAAITPEEIPVKDGCTFFGWNEIPETMPAHDVTVTGTFGANPCTIVFNTDGGSPITYISGESGSEVTPPDDPTREGYTFLGWEPAIPETMPEEGLIVTAQWQINSYTLLYMVDDEEYNRSEVEYGTEITPLEEPTKEGYTFSGWSEIPETMPGGDVVVTGNFTINNYTLTYIINDEEYKTFTLVYGSEIVPEEEPSREGYTFSGWSEIPETMPAHDVTVTGTFTGISYNVTFIVDGEEYKTDSIPYGTPLTSLEEPTKEGYTFSGWNDLPETMPAEDIVITGTFIINQYLLTYLVDGEEYKSYEIDYNMPLTPEAEPTKKGMTFSGWNEMPETMPANDVTVTGSFSWSMETLDGIVYEVADTLSNYASVIGYEGESEEAELLSEVVIGGDSYTVYSIAEDALPHTLTIHTSVGRLLLWLWSNGYTDIKEIETGRDLSAPEVSLAHATASSLTLSFANDYPEFSETVEVSGSPVEKGENGYSMKLTGLDPDYEYEGLASVTLTFEDASYTKTCSFRTEPLNLNTLLPKVISEGNVIVAAESNLDDDEANVGFKWRRTAWEDDEEIFPSRSGVAYLYEGMMEGIIRNLSSNPWKVRPFYTSNAGNTYYGAWRGIDPSDYSYFEPTVHTYAALAVTDSTAEVKGYAMQGTDNVESQGIMYWENTPSSSSRRKADGIPDNAKIVEVFSPVMKVTLSGLDYDTEYNFVAFVKTANGETFYGEQQSFRTTSDPDGIDEIEDSTLEIEEAWYSLDGKKLAKPQKGINIIRYSDGTTKKVLIK